MDENYNEDPANFLYNEAEYFQKKADRYREAAQLIEDDNFDGDGQNGTYTGSGDREVTRGRNGGFSNAGRSRGGKADEVFVGNGGRGNRSFSDSGNQNDARTIAGRQSHDDDGWSEDELWQFISDRDQKYMHKDGETFDRRTDVGRALYAAGMIDDDGYPMENNNSRGRGGNNRPRYNNTGGNGRGRSSNTNSNRGRSTSNR